MKSRALALVVVLATLVGAGAGCVVVPQNRRKYLADPMMRFQADALEAHAHQKLYGTREAASGGDGEPAGGGCACQ
ncbi:MAG TPA: DUF4266 domain-containing protein [Polyangia bacterium]|nr:DUF4266 domain-containing protein [Polyangia bacterium]